MKAPTSLLGSLLLGNLDDMRGLRSQGLFLGPLGLEGEEDVVCPQEGGDESRQD